MNLADEIDKVADGFFGSPANTKYFLSEGRYEDKDQKSFPKPVFAGCDAHNFDDLRAWLGEEARGSNAKHVTWVKADLTFEGLQQTLIEPSERIRLQVTIPDKKEPYKVISRITFGHTNLFPSEVVFNPGLNAIIGSRSAGKSALLAYLAHAVDPEYTVSRQVSAGINENMAGPGASITWGDVGDMEYKVEWQSPSAKSGQIIYVPQNSLFAISERPDEIAAKIEPVVSRTNEEFRERYRAVMSNIVSANETIKTGIADWYLLAGEIDSLANEVRGLGDRNAVIERKQGLEKQISALKESSSLTTTDLDTYQRVIEEIGAYETRLEKVEEAEKDLNPYTKLQTDGQYLVTDGVSINLSVIPAPGSMPEELQEMIEQLLRSAKREVLEQVKSAFVNYRLKLDKELLVLRETIQKLRADNKNLIEKYANNEKILALVEELEGQKKTISDINSKTALRSRKLEEQVKVRDSIVVIVTERDQLVQDLVDRFNKLGHTVEGIRFALEADYDPETIKRISAGFNKIDKSPYIVDRSRVDLPQVFKDPGAFIDYLGSGKQKFNNGTKSQDQMSEVLTTSKISRFVAYLDGDRIGGFSQSSMTPGKQALFALTLILAESEEPWPLLIDQPEDDLDSRSVCDVIVRDLITRKRERQIIMVSHNANLVIGADSEEIIVANRHGDDRPNKDGRMFDYLTGSLEYTKSKDWKAESVLESLGIREHACELLDGGADAFQKRKDKYRI